MEAKAATLLPDLEIQVGAAALQFVAQNFRKQGFQGATFEPWDKRVNDKDPSRPVLQGKGTAHLKKSVHDTYPGEGRIVLTSSLPYSQIHNEGGIIHHPSHPTTLNFSADKDNKLRLSKVRTINQQRQITTIRNAEVPAYDINITKRQYMGPSPVLDARILKIIINALKTLDVP